MRTVTSVEEMQRLSREARRGGARIGFVPTMGCLHEGHVSLMRVARRQSDWVVVSVFVNPTQFGPGEDFDRYPRDIERDSSLCLGAGVDVVFAPAVADLYAGDRSVCVEESALSRGLCGRSRPGHFRGVATVVAVLFNIVGPDLAVFGQKDAQQVRVIRRVARDLHFPVRIVEAPTRRELDGLAMSSRNVYLSAPERQRATCLYRALELARALVEGGERDAAVLCRRMRRIIEDSGPAAVDYVEIVDDETLEPVVRIDRRALAALAVRIGSTRLIDNGVLDPSSPGR